MCMLTHCDAPRRDRCPHSVPFSCPSPTPTIPFPVASLDEDVVIFAGARDLDLAPCSACPPWDGQHPAEFAIDHRNRLGNPARRTTCAASLRELIWFLAGEADDLLVWFPTEHPAAVAVLPELPAVAGDAA